MITRPSFMSPAGPIGIAFDARWIRAAQLNRSGDKPALARVVRIRRRLPIQNTVKPLSRQEAADLAGVLDRHGFVGTSIVLAAPNALSTLTTVDLPPRSSGAPIEQIATMELARVHHVPAGSFEVALWELPKGQERGARASASTYMAAVVEHDRGEEMITPLESVGLTVIRLAPEACLTARAMTPLTLGQPAAIVHLGWSSLDVLVLAADGSLIFHRSLDERGAASFYAKLAQFHAMDAQAVDGAILALQHRESGDVPFEWSAEMTRAADAVARLIAEHADRVVDEISRSLNYAVRRAPGVDQRPLRIVGEAATWPSLAHRLAERLDLQVRVAAVGEVIPVSPGAGKATSDCDLMPAIGAALSGLEVDQRSAA